jgi:hybrid cluster-associated redox disulfide protein
MSIVKDHGIGEVVDLYPETADIFFQYGMGCLGCAIANFESIEEGALAHGINVDDLVRDLNKAVAGQEEGFSCRDLLSAPNRPAP